MPFKEFQNIVKIPIAKPDNADRLKIIYRICDHRGGLTRIPGISKLDCFSNYLSVFGNHNLIIVADNVTPQTLALLEQQTEEVHKTNLGNSGSFMYALELATGLPENQFVYLLEDDYLHLPGSGEIILEGLERAEYVSLYDHADKYMQNSPNPFVKGGGETTKIILTESTHWKHTNSTTMTFAARVSILRQDYAIFRQYCTKNMPRDFQIFLTLITRKKRRLLTPIPARSTHCDPFPSPLIDWRKVAEK